MLQSTLSYIAFFSISRTKIKSFITKKIYARLMFLVLLNLNIDAVVAGNSSSVKQSDNQMNHIPINRLILDVDIDISYGPDVLSIAHNKFRTTSNYSSNTLFNLANDGRFSFASALGYIYHNIGIEFKYFNLNPQHLLGVNGQALALNQIGSFGGRYLGVNGLALIPVNNDRNEFIFALGGGKLLTEFHAALDSETNINQSESVLLTGFGVRHFFSSNWSVRAEYDYLTPITHGLLSSGIYNDSFGVILLGTAVSYDI